MNSRGAALGDYLRACRARIQPQDKGFPEDGRRRRVRGLRREELAQLAGVSVDYLVRLEQGRTNNVSRAVLDALARALDLQPDEHDYLLRIAGPIQRGTISPRVRPQTQRLLDSLHEVPAVVIDRRMDVLAWNPLGAALFADFATLPAAQRNLVWLAFLDPRGRALYSDWEKVAQECVAYLRMDAARYPDDPRLSALVGELSVKDPDFRRWWADHKVRAQESGRKGFRHPVAGEFVLDFQTLTIQEDQKVLVYTAEPDSRSQEALRFLAGWTHAPSADNAASRLIVRPSE